MPSKEPKWLRDARAEGRIIADSAAILAQAELDAINSFDPNAMMPYGIKPNSHEAAERAKELRRTLRTPKYRNCKTEADGIVFDSRREADRYFQLKMLLATNMIRGLQLQVSFDLVVNGIKVSRYVADFVYEERLISDEWGQVVEDAKGFRTREYKMKARLMLAVHGIVIRET